jgi:preprotein translocase subunit Sec63
LFSRSNRPASSSELENTAPRIKSDFKPEHADLIDAQKRKRLRKERRIKRIVTVILGYAVMAWMVYLIVVTARTVTKAYDPYDILGVARVSYLAWEMVEYTSMSIDNFFLENRAQMRRLSPDTTSACR